MPHLAEVVAVLPVDGQAEAHGHGTIVSPAGDGILVICFGIKVYRESADIGFFSHGVGLVEPYNHFAAILRFHLPCGVIAVKGALQAGELAELHKLADGLVALSLTGDFSKVLVAQLQQIQLIAQFVIYV